MKNPLNSKRVPAALIVLLLLTFTLAVMLELQSTAVAGEVRSAATMGWGLQTSGDKAQLWHISPYSADVCWISAFSSALYKTANGGDLWEKAYDAGASVSVVDPTHIWTVQASIVYWTTDGGLNWSSKDFGAGYFFLSVFAVDANIAWATGESGVVVKTTNGGADWSDVSEVTSDQMCDVEALDENTAWIAGWAAVYWTTNGGANWDKYIPVGGGLSSISVVDANTVWTCGNSILKTTDGGKNWQTQHTGDQSVGICAINANVAWAVDCTGHIMKTTDGQGWFLQKSTGIQLRDIAAVDDKVAWACAFGGIIYHTTDGGGSQYPPSIASLSSSSGSTGSILTINGANFGAAKDTSYVSFGSVAATEYTYWSDIKINVKVPVGVEGQVMVKVTTAGGTSNQKTFYVSVPKNNTYYFAEGCTREGFSEYLSLQNPGTSAISVTATYMLAGGETWSVSYPVAASSRTSVDVNNACGPGQDVSVMLTSNNEFFAERPMYFVYKPNVPGYAWADGHVAAGAPLPRYDWYFAEGCTRDGFEEWLCIQNPQNVDTVVNIYYISAGAYQRQVDYTVSAHSRLSVFVNGDMGPGQDVSARVHGQQPIVVERPMYFSYNPLYNVGSWNGGHDVMGTDAPKYTWYFAEGCTRAGFEEWICIQNPNPAAANVAINYATSAGPILKQYNVPANSRGTINVNQEVGLDLDVSCKIVSSQNIICERPMYFSYTGMGAPGWSGGSDVLGVAEARNKWCFPEGYTGAGFHEWFCLNNVGTSTASVNITYNIQGAAPRTVHHTVPPGRYTVFVNQDAGWDLQFSTIIESPVVPITAERSMYFNYAGWDGGHCGTGFSP